MLPKALLTSHSRMSGSRKVITPLWLSRSLRLFLYSSSMYLCHLFLISSASVRSILFLSFIVPIFAWNVLLLSLIFLKRSLVFLILLFSSTFCIVHLWRLSSLSLLFFRTLHRMYTCLILLFIFSVSFLLLVGKKHTWRSHLMASFILTLQLERTSRSLALGLVEGCTLGGPSSHHSLAQNLTILREPGDLCHPVMTALVSTLCVSPDSTASSLPSSVNPTESESPLFVSVQLNPCLGWTKWPLAKS